jgi:hypothetical protein
MRKIYCKTCGTLIAELVPGSRLKIGAVHYCKQCHHKKTDIPDFLRGLNAGKRP